MKKSLLSKLLVYSILVVFYLVGILEFGLWDQVLYLKGVELLNLDVFTHAHFFRYALVLPIFELAELTGIHHDRLFSWLCLAFIILISRLIEKITLIVSPVHFKSTFMLTLMSYLLMIMLATLMNGRILFALLGFALLIHNFLRWEHHMISFKRMALITLLSYFLCTVSSGTFLVSIMFSILWVFTPWRRKKSIELKLFFIILFVSLSPIISLYIFKNIDFYGGGFWGLVNMLNHGAGVLFFYLEVFTVVQLAILITIIGVLILSAIFYFKRYRFLIMALIVSSFGGAFGFSTLSIGAPVVFTIFNLVLLGGFNKLKFPQVNSTQCFNLHRKLSLF